MSTDGVPLVEGVGDFSTVNTEIRNDQLHLAQRERMEREREIILTLRILDQPQPGGRSPLTTHLEQRTGLYPPSRTIGSSRARRCAGREQSRADFKAVNCYGPSLYEWKGLKEAPLFDTGSMDVVPGLLGLQTVKEKAKERSKEERADV